MQKNLFISSLVLVSIGLAGCTTPSGGGSVMSRPAPVVIDPAVGDPCIEAAMAKYFIGSERVAVLSSSPQGGSTAVTMKADVRDAVCLVSATGKVISLTDTTPKSANQIAAEEAAAAAAAAGPVEAPKVVKKKKKAAKKPAAAPAVATPAVEGTKPSTATPKT